MAEVETSLIITIEDIDTGKKGQRSLTDVSSEATDEELLSFSKGIIGLTTNTYVQTAKVAKTILD